MIGDSDPKRRISRSKQAVFDNTLFGRGLHANANVRRLIILSVCLGMIGVTFLTIVTIAPRLNFWTDDL